MELNPIGLVSAMAAFMSIWWGHVAVRKIETVSLNLWLPMTAAFGLGVLSEIIAARTENIQLSTVFGIIGVVFLWDTFEFYRQQKRVEKGHAPANPNNPRHAQILKNYPAATTLDVLNRNPHGDKYSHDEMTAMQEDAK